MIAEILDTEIDDLKRTEFKGNDEIRMELGGFLTIPTGWQGKSHSHPFWELIYINQDEGEMTCNGTITSLKGPQLFLIPPFEEHKFTNTGKEDAEHLYLGFSFDMDLGEVDINIENCLTARPDVALILKEFKEMGNSFRSGEAESKMSYFRPRFMEITLKVIKLLIAKKEPVKSSSAHRNQMIADKAKVFLEANLDRNVTVQEIASHFYISPTYFGEIFKNVTGSSIKNYHNMLKMNSAIIMLKQTGLQIQEIADKLGFESIHYFSRKFKEYYKIPPTEYRQNS